MFFWKKANSKLLLCLNSQETYWALFSCTAVWDTSGVVCFVLGSPMLERCGHTGDTKVIKGLEHVSHRKTWRELALSSLENKKTQEGIYQCVWIPSGKSKEDGTRFFQTLPGDRMRTMSTTGNRRNSIQAYRLPCLLWARLNTEIGCPEKLWNFCPGRYSKLDWAWSQTTCYSWPWFEWEFGLGDPQRSILTSLILYVYFSLARDYEGLARQLWIIQTHFLFCVKFFVT